MDAPRHGLSQAEAAARLARHGANRLPPPRRRGPLARFLLQFHNVLIHVLLAAGLVTAVLGHWVDSGVIFGVVVINAVIGFIQEGKAEAALEAIRKMLSPSAVALRDGARRSLPAEELVPGDIVFLASGDRVPVDLRLLETKGLEVDEAVLTGESLPVAKRAEAVAPDAPLGDRASMAWSGTLVTHGHGVGVAVATGAATELGRISALLAEVQPLATPLLRQMAAFGRWLTWVILAIAALAFAFGVLVRAYAPGEMFLAAVGLAVAAIPEGLPAVMTITLAIGVRRMARRKAIIRRLPAVEALGSVTVICTDKTGTLTQNEMTAQCVITADDEHAVSGVGYAPNGGFLLDGREVSVDAHPELIDIARAGLLCNDATLTRVGEAWELAGDPTEGALLTLALKAGLEPAEARAALARVDVIPFEARHRFMATLHRDHRGHGLVFLKGAPERVLELCHWQRQAGEDRPIERAAWLARLNRAAARGMRLLALATREQAEAPTGLEFADVEAGGFTLLAAVGLADPPRAESGRAVAACQAAGVRVVMITGDHADTALAIGRALGLARAGGAVSGAELEAMDAVRLREVVGDAEVFARASPEHKLRLVEALQAGGAVVAMTGDGVNDAPALKRADIGVAMGITGTDVSKDAAAMVLTDDNFSTIVAAVEEGRTIADNLRKFLKYLLTTNSAEIWVMLLAPFFGMPLPLLPLQILWINLVTDGLPALCLGLEPTEPGVMNRPPRPPQESLFARGLGAHALWVGLLMAGLSLAAGYVHWRAGRPEWRTVLFTTLALAQMAHVMVVRSEREPLFSRGFFRNPALMGAVAATVLLQAVVVYWKPLREIFATQPLTPELFSAPVAAALTIVLAVELEKTWRRRR
jgi:magnesium-transporting ATPase (P-type)